VCVQESQSIDGSSSREAKGRGIVPNGFSVEPPCGVLEVDVVQGCTGLAVSTLEKLDFLCDSGSDGSVKASLSGGDSGEVFSVSPADGQLRSLEWRVVPWR
jgi:hypothetical protein